MSARVITGDCLDVLPTLDAESVDAIVTDPPYGLSFMGKGWDHAVPGVEFWRAALRAAKPGAHLAAFGGTRTYHRLTCAIEDAGWEIRDCLSWLYGSGFPKSLDVSKAIDKTKGAEREIIGHRRVVPGVAFTQSTPAATGASSVPITRPATDEPRQWRGYGTALKPAWEPIILARKPLIGTVAANVMRHSAGALNVDGCRIGTESLAATRRGVSRLGTFDGADGNVTPAREGRWPANVALDEVAAELLDEQSGESVGGSPSDRRVRGGLFGPSADGVPCGPQYGDTGGASRFFYTAKASASERNAGLEHFAAIRRTDGRDTDIENPRLRTSAAKNHHPTVKPLALMQWLCRLVTPKGGLILDPFCGSGTTGRAAIAEGFGFIGIELSPEYAEIARARIAEYAPLFADGAA